jgi:Tetracyclin repressor-like, C-terminal domain
MTGPDSNERFAFGLDLILDGLEATSAAEKAARPIA